LGVSAFGYSNSAKEFIYSSFVNWQSNNTANKCAHDDNDDDDDDDDDSRVLSAINVHTTIKMVMVMMMMMMMVMTIECWMHQNTVYR
jgi:uncharacterized protein (DUF983 family)